MAFKRISEQVRIIRSRAKRLLINAGPGTAKTTVLAMCAIKHATRLIRGALHWADKDARVLLVSLTNNAADEAQDRISLLIHDTTVQRLIGRIKDPKAVQDRIICSTIHSFALRMLRKHIRATPYERTILVDNESNEEILTALLQQYQSKLATLSKPKEILLDIYFRKIKSRKPYNQIIAEHYPQYSKRTRIIRTVLKELEAQKVVLKVITHDDTLWQFLRLLREKPPIRTKIQKQYPVIIVDEFQDTGTVQWQIIKKLTSPKSYLIAAGDDGQTIFVWAGASLKRFRHFQTSYPKSKTFPLIRNRRSTREIAQLSNALINQVRFVSKKQVTASKRGKKPQVVLSEDRGKLFHYISDEIKKSVKAGTRLEDIAILYRFHYDALALQHHLAQNLIPFKVYGDKSWRDRPFVNLIFAFIRIIEHCATNDDWWKVLLEVDGVGKRNADNIMSWLKEKNHRKTLYPKQLRFQQPLQQLLQFMASLQGSNAPNQEKLKTIVEFIQTRMPKVNNTIRNHQLTTIIKLVHDSRSLFGVIDKYFDRSYPLYYPGEDGPPYPDSYVTLSTIHQSKGSGFDTVFLLGTGNLMFEKHGCFASPKKREEELLDMNVAVTRARHELHLLFPIDEQTWAHSKDDPNPWTFIRKANGKLYDLVRL